MTIQHALSLGIIEGVTEFLPISSTGHLIAAGAIMGLPETEALKSFDISIQLGAILAAALLMAPKALKQPRNILLALVGFLPTGFLGFLFGGVVKEHLFSVSVVISTLFVGGVALIVFERWMKSATASITSFDSITFKHALLIGLAQSVALLPGTSRSMMTLMAAMLLGMERKTAVEFSFLLAVPTMAAATGFDLLHSASSFSTNDISLTIVGFLTALITAGITIEWLLHYVQKHTFRDFGIYRIVLALALSFIFL